MAEERFLMNPKNKPNDLKSLNPQQALVLKMQADQAGAFDTGSGTYNDLRANYRREREKWNTGGPKMAETMELEVPYKGHIVHARLLRPVRDRNLPVLFFIHGGGMTVGDNDTHSLMQRKLAAYSGCAVIGIEYTLSPEAQYPQPVYECATVIRHVVNFADTYGINAQQIGFSGDSGGANLAMGTLLYLRDNGFPMDTVKGAVLYYGGYGLIDGRSYRLHGGAWDGMSEADLLYYQKMYIGERDVRDCPYYCIYSNDLSYGLPPCFLAAAQLDPLVDDNRLFRDILTDLGVHCEYHEYPGVLHAFAQYSKVMDDAEDALRRGAHFFARTCGLQGEEN